MGARESRSQREADDDGDNDNDTTTSQAQDYYAILEVDENASADEIRVSLSFPSLVPSPTREHPKCACPGPAMPTCCVALRVASLYADRAMPFFDSSNRDSVRSDASRSYIILTRIMMTLKVRPGASLHCSKRMRYVRLYYHIDANVPKSGVRGRGWDLERRK
jgi:hypothetical protein